MNIAMNMALNLTHNMALNLTHNMALNLTHNMAYNMAHNIAKAKLLKSTIYLQHNNVALCSLHAISPCGTRAGPCTS